MRGRVVGRHTPNQSNQSKMLTIDCDPIAVEPADAEELLFQMSVEEIIDYLRMHGDRADVSRSDLSDVIDSAQLYYWYALRGTDQQVAEYDDLLGRLEQRFYHSDEWQQNQVPVNTPNQTDDESGDPE